MKSFLIGAIGLTVAIVAPVSLLVIALIWLLQKDHERNLNRQLEDQRFIIELPADEVVEEQGDSEVVEQAVATGKVVKLNDYKT